MKRHFVIFLYLSLIMIFWMRGWWNSGIPLTPREENIPQLTDIWRLRSAARQDNLWSSWNPQDNTGAPNLIQRSYLLLAPLAQISFTLNISVNTVYKIAVLLAFSLSGLGMFLLLKENKLSFFASLIGGSLFMLSPPHLTLGSDLLDFNYFWTTIPWIFYLLERFFRTNNTFIYGGLIGGLMTVSLITGNTYFVALAPFFSLYFTVKIFLISISLKQKTKFIFLIFYFFITTSAFIALPSLIEKPYVWLSQEVKRKQIIDLPSPSHILSLFYLRWTNYPATAWNLKTRYPDMSWYLGSVAVALVFISFFCLKQLFRQAAPLFLLIGLFVPFFLVTRLNLLKRLLIPILNNFTGLQAMYDRTYRLFLLPVFALAFLGAIGAQLIISKTTFRFKPFVSVIIFLLVLVDYYPLSNYFYSLPSNQLILSPKIATILNTPSYARYLSPYTYAKPLPKYRYEYVNRFVNANRINSEYTYTTMAPRYTSELYEQSLFTIFEKDNPLPSQVLQMLDWGSTEYIFFQSRVFNYEPKISQMIKTGWQVVYQDNLFSLIKNPNFSPPVRIYEDFEPVSSGNKDNLQYWLSHSDREKGLYYSNKTVLISSAGGLQNTSRITNWQRPVSNVYSVAVQAGRPALVSISESYFPGWLVKVNGKTQAPLRTNYGFMGVIVPQGTHQVEFVYQQPWYYLVGKIISLSSIILILKSVFNQSLKNNISH